MASEGETLIPHNYAVTNSQWQQNRKQWQEAQDRSGAYADEQLADAASGKSSVAQGQLRQGMTGAQQAMAGAAAGRGSNPLAQRAAMYGGGQLAAQTNAQAASLRGQEMQAAHAMRQNVLQQQAAGLQGYDQMALQGAMATAENELTATGLRQAEDMAAWNKAIGVAGAITGGGGAAMSAMSDERMKLTGVEGLDFLRENGVRGIDWDQPGARAANRPSYMNHPKWTGVEGVDYLRENGVRGVDWDQPSDERVKDRVAGLGRQLDASDAQMTRQLGLSSDPRVASLASQLDASDARMQQGLRAPPPRGPADMEAARVSAELDAAADETMRKLVAEPFVYRPEARALGAPPGPRAGIMAQDLERTPLGHGAVKQDPRGVKHIDVPQTASLAAGLAGRAGRRLDEQEQRQGDQDAYLSELEARLRRLEGGR